MGQAYTPGLKVTGRTRHRARRILPIAGDVLVNVGDRVSARDVVARTLMPGDVIPINVANVLSMPPADAAECMLVGEGDQVEVGQVLARSKGIFGMFRSECKSKSAGTVETISSVTGQVILRGEPQRIEVHAYLTGEVVEALPGEGVVIEADVAFIQGIFGIGGETFGPLVMACADHEQELVADLIKPSMKGAVIVGGARVTDEAIRRAIEIKAAAIVAGGIDDQDLRDLLGYDLGVAITGSEKVGITLVITEGFGEIAMAKRTFELLASHEGDEAAVNGTTQIRAGVMRPEIVIPLSAAAAAHEKASTEAGGLLEIGTTVRVIRDPYFGILGTVAALPPEPQVLESGSKARVLEVRFESGKNVVIPRANVELIEG